MRTSSIAPPTNLGISVGSSFAHPAWRDDSALPNVATWDRWKARRLVKEAGELAAILGAIVRNARLNAARQTNARRHATL